MDITRAKIRDLRKALDSKQISAAELCGEYFRNIEAGDGKVQSFITVTKEKALEMAENAQKRIDSGDVSPLTGIPLAIKDNICTDGIKTARQVDGLRPRDRLRRGRNALADHAVVCRKHVNAGVADFVFDLPGDARQLDRKVLQQTEAAGRFGQCVLPGLRLAHGHIIKRGNFGKQRNKLPFSLFHRVHSKRCFSTSQSRLGLSCVSSSVHVACGESASSRERSPAISITPSKSAACRSRSP